MSISELLQILSEKNIYLRLEDDALKIRAPKGVLTYDLQLKLKDNKDQIVEWLKKASLDKESAGSDLPQLVHDSVNLYQQFPLSDLQVAFYLANDAFMEFQVRPHYYMEDTHNNLDRVRYQAAWNKALQRHRHELVLMNDQGQLQLLDSLPELEIKVNDFGDISGGELEVELMNIRNSMMRSELPLDRWPWFDLQLSTWTEGGIDRARIHYNNNNFYSDGLGTTKFMKEIWSYYHQPSLVLEPLEIGIRDAILALEKLDETELGQQSRKYWLDRLENLPGPPQIPLVAGKERRCRAKLNRREFYVDHQTWQRFKDNASLHGLTASNAILTAHAKIMATWSGNDYFIISHMMTRRLPIHPQIKDILGNFASLYPLEIDFRDEATFVQHALRIQQQVLSDSSQLNWGGTKVMRELNRLKGEMGTSPCPYVVGSGIFMGGYDKPEFSCLETSQTLLDHQFWELLDGSYYAVWDLLEEYFPQGMIDTMWSAYKRLFLELANDPDCWRRVNINVLPANDLIPRQICNESSLVLAGGLLHSALFVEDLECADSLALITDTGSLTYQQLREWSDGVGSLLVKQGIQPGDKVALVVERGIELLPALYGILKVGAAYIPINPELPKERCQYLITNSNAKLVLTQSKYCKQLELIEDAVVIMIDGSEMDLNPEETFAEVDESDLAYIIYTSGSTGSPKGVAIDHQGAVNTIQDINQRFEVGNGDCIFGVSAYSFDLSVYDVFGALDAGATLVYPNPEASFNPTHWLDMMTQFEVTIWNSAPALMTLLVEVAIRQNVQLLSLRLVLLSGDWIPLRLSGDIQKIAPNAKIVSLGGATEASVWSVYYPIDSVDNNWLSIPYGFPLANQRWHILDKAGNPTPTWTPGELYIAGKGLAVCYWGDEEKTNISFIQHEQSGERLYRTGDQGRYTSDGSIEFLGRLDSQVKIQGHRIELGEIESTLRQHKLVSEVIVMALEGEQKHLKKLVAYVIASDEILCLRDELIDALEEHLKLKLPIYMVPKVWSVLDKYPVTSNGKIDRKALEKLEVINSEKTIEKTTTRIFPRNPLETQLAQLWSQVIVDIEFGVTDDFFDIGGQSFDAVRVMGMLQEHFSRPLSLGDMWRQRTIENLAKLLSKNIVKQESCLVDVVPEGAGSPWYLVHPAGGYCIRYGELGRLLPQPVFGLQAIGLDGITEPLSNIRDMATRYIGAIREHQPNGPYRIGGWSSGGLIAFEIASQLIASGEIVLPMLIVDCPSPHEHESVSNFQMLCWFLEDLAMDLPLEALGSEELFSFDGKQQLFQAIDILNDNTPTNLDAELLWPIYNVFRNIVSAGRDYYPEKTSVDIILCRAADGEVTEFSHHPYKNSKDWGWANLTKRQVRTEFMSGTHHSLLDVPNVTSIARAMMDVERKHEPA